MTQHEERFAEPPSSHDDDNKSESLGTWINRIFPTLFDQPVAPAATEPIAATGDNEVDLLSDPVQPAFSRHSLHSSLTRYRKAYRHQQQSPATTPTGQLETPPAAIAIVDTTNTVLELVPVAHVESKVATAFQVFDSENYGKSSTAEALFSSQENFKSLAKPTGMAANSNPTDDTHKNAPVPRLPRIQSFFCKRIDHDGLSCRSTNRRPTLTTRTTPTST